MLVALSLWFIFLLNLCCKNIQFKYEEVHKRQMLHAKLRVHLIGLTLLKPYRDMSTEDVHVRGTQRRHSIAATLILLIWSTGSVCPSWVRIELRLSVECPSSSLYTGNRSHSMTVFIAKCYWKACELLQPYKSPVWVLSMNQNNVHNYLSVVSFFTFLLYLGLSSTILSVYLEICFAHICGYITYKNC